MSGSNALQIADPNAGNPLAQAPSWADAAQSVGGSVSSGVDALGQWLAAQRAKSSQMGLWNDQTGLPTGAGVVNAAGQYSNALMMGSISPRVFHGTAQPGMSFDPNRPAFFTTDPARASFYAESGAPRYVGDIPQPNVIPAYLDMKNPKIIEGLAPSEQHAAFKAAQDAGHDGVILRNKGVPDTHVSFNPSQIMSGIGQPQQ